MHLMKLNPSPFERIKNGSKRVEIRLFDKKRQKLKANELIQFSNIENPKEKIIVEILNLTRFSTFQELLLNTPMEKFGYSQNHDIQKFLESIYTIYTKTQEETYGVLAIEVKLLD